MKSIERLLSAALLAFGLLPASAGYGQEADILLVGGMLLDGTGADAVRADVAIQEGRILAVGELAGMQASRSIDAAGLYLAPGFIDLHSHADRGLSDPHLASAINNITQGITTVVVGQDGRHAWPVGGSLVEQTRLWSSHGIGNNVIPLVGQGSARLEVMGWSREPARADQVEAIAGRVRELLEQGAWGVSTGLEYFPGRFSSTEEVIEAARPVKEIDGFYISHLRDEADRLLSSIDETIRVCRETGVRAVVTHMQVRFRRNWGRAQEAVDLIAEARRGGLPVYADLYPYHTASDGIDVSLVPMQALFDPEDLRSLTYPGNVSARDALEWAYRVNPSMHQRYTKDFLLEQPDDVIFEVLGNRGVASQLIRHRLREVMADGEKARDLLHRVEERLADPPAGPESNQTPPRWGEMFTVEQHPEDNLEGLTLAAVARARSVSEARAAVELTLEGASFTQYRMFEPDVITFIGQPFVAAITDGGIPEYGDGLTHPRNYGAFVRRIRRYVYELGVMDLPFAIHTATGLTAEIVGIEDRGTIKEGQWADVIAFDPRRLRDRATFRHPHRYSEGILWVLVNGEVVLENGEPNDQRAGRVLLKNQR